MSQHQGELADTVHHILHSEDSNQLQQRVKIFIAQDRARSSDSNNNRQQQQYFFTDLCSSPTWRYVGFITSHHGQTVLTAGSLEPWSPTNSLETTFRGITFDGYFYFRFRTPHTCQEAVRILSCHAGSSCGFVFFAMVFANGLIHLAFCKRLRNLFSTAHFNMETAHFNMDYISNLFLDCITPQSTLLFGLVALVLGYWHRSRRSGSPQKPLPPSPFQLPIVGCLPFLGSLPRETFTKWANKFGKIYSCRLGSKLIVVILNDADFVRDAFSKPIFNGRPFMYTTQETSKVYGISFASDETWPIHRRFAFKTFMALDVGKGHLEEQITDEADRLVNDIRKFEGKPFSNKNLLLNAVGNVVCGVLFGQRFEGGNRAETDAFYDKRNAVFRFFGSAGVLNIFPILRIILNVRQSFARVFREVIKNHEDNLDSTVILDFTDAFIKEKEQGEGC